jgi:hypothetical protein
MRYAREPETGDLRYPSMGELRRLRGAEVPPEVIGPSGDLIPSELAPDEYVDAAMEWRPPGDVRAVPRLGP